MKKTAALTAALLIAANGAAAQTTVDIKTDVAEGTVTVSGICDVSGDYIYLQVLKPGKSAADLKYGSIDESLFYTDDTVAGANGEYSIEFEINDAASGDYIFRIRAKRALDSVEKTVNIAGPSEINEMLNIINHAESVSDANLRELFNSTKLYSLLAVESGLVSMAEDKALVCENVYNAKEESPFVIEKLVNLKELIHESLAISVINMHNADSEKVMREYADEIGYRGNAAADKIYDEFLDEKQRSDFMRTIGEGNIKSCAELCNIYPEEIFLYAVKNCRWQSLQGIVQVYSDKLPGIKLDEYKALKDSHGAAESVSGKDFASFGAFAEAFNSAVKLQKEKEKTPEKGKNYGGGGGGSSRTAETAPFVPVEIPKEEAVIFNDIKNVPWASEAIKSLAARRVIKGISDGVFAPDKGITREEFVKIFVGAFDLYQENARCSFEDVDKSAWYYQYIATAWEAGLISGIGDNLFGTGKGISRQEVCLILYRSIRDKLPLKYSEDMQTKFSDTDMLSEEAREAITVLSHNGIISGTGDGIFAPYDKMTRAQAAVIICNAMKEKG